MKEYSTMDSVFDSLHYEIIKGSKGVEYINLPCAFDIETTSYKSKSEKHAFMYIWMIGIGHNNGVYYGRTWDEFKDALNRISHHLNTSSKRRLIIYVHNLSYEFQFLKNLFHWEDIFASNPNKPLKALTDSGIEFRCSYQLSGMSLERTAANLTTYKIKKLVGDLDYSLIRHHETKITSQEMEYCNNDIEIVTAYIDEQIMQLGDITKIPLTNTGRVRQFVRSFCYHRKPDGTKVSEGQRKRYRSLMNALTLDMETYKQLCQTFMGGYTHANAYYTNRVLKNVSSIDFTSSYPSVMLSEKFPMSKFTPCNNLNRENFIKLMKTKCVIFKARFKNIRQKIEQDSYLSSDKCIGSLKNPTINNGRVYSADELTTYLTEVDYSIMAKVYDWDGMDISEVKYAEKGYLPKPIIESILALYQDKTMLKGVEGMETEYLLSKGMLNSIYGMCVTNIVQPKAVIDDSGIWRTEPVNEQEILDAHNESHNRFLYYAWGVYVTAYARRNLWTGILEVKDDYIYSDTDSLKIMNYENHLEYIKKFDQRIINKMHKMCDYHKIDKSLLNPKTKEGIEKMIGIWDYEGTYEKFKTLGAKRYIVQENGKITITVAGLTKQNGVNYMLEYCNYDSEKVFDMFNDSLYIPPDRTGKMTHTYIDYPSELLITDYQGKTTHVSTPSGIHLEPCEFTLSMSIQYLTFIKNLSEGYTYTGTKYV